MSPQKKTCGYIKAKDSWVCVFVKDPSPENARLIAAAPELLDALEICKEVMEYISEYDIPPTWPAKVKAAIAKAKGE